MDAAWSYFSAVLARIPQDALDFIEFRDILVAVAVWAILYQAHKARNRHRQMKRMRLEAWSAFFGALQAGGVGLVFLLFVYSPYQHYQAMKSEADDLRKQVAALQGQVVDRDNKLASINDELIALKNAPKPPLLADKVGAEMADALKRLNQTIAKSKPEKVPLKTRAKYLSDEILQFTDERRSHEPGFSFESKSDEQIQAEMNRRSKYDQVTKALFSRRFASRIIEIRNELAAAGAVDEELDKHYEYSTNYIVMRIIAVRIGVLAERLP